MHCSIAEGALGRFERSGGAVVLHGEWGNVGRTVPLDAFDGGWEIGDLLNPATLRGGTYLAAGGRDTVRVPRRSLADKQREALVALVPEPAAGALLALSILCAGRRHSARPRRVRFNCT